MRFPKDFVYSAVDIRHEGLTLKKTKKVVSKIYKILVKAVSSVWRWCKKFAKHDTEIIQGLSDLLHIDETEIELFNGEKAWFWGVKCPRTKKFVATHISKARTLQDAKFLFWEARRRFPPAYWPKSIRTDGWPGYRRAIFEVFGHGVKHDKFLSFKSHSNNEIENSWRMKNWFPRFRNIESGRIHTRHVISEFNAEKDNFLEKFIIRLCNSIDAFWYRWAFKMKKDFINMLPATVRVNYPDSSEETGFKTIRCTFKLEDYAPITDVLPESVVISETTDAHYRRLRSTQRSMKASITFLDGKTKRWHLNLLIRNDHDSNPPEINLDCELRCGSARYSIPKKVLARKGKNVHSIKTCENVFAGIEFLGKSITLAGRKDL